MKNIEQWKPSKFIYSRGQLRASRAPSEVSVGSRLIVDIIGRFYQKHLKDHARGRLIDLGCGKVPLFHAYRDYVTETVCVDWENTLHKNPYLDIECDLTRRLPFDDEAFDTVILSDVLEHIPQPEFVWHEIARILRPGGRLLMNVPFYYWIHEDPHDYHRYTQFALRRSAEIVGLELIHLEELGGAPEIMTDITAKVMMQHVPLIGRPVAKLLQSLTYLLFVSNRLGRKISRRTSYSFPFGYFLIAAKTEQSTNP
ncbi:MAG: methyltransferase domain-containing protein [Isosphaeraceae bacterium]